MLRFNLWTIGPLQLTGLMLLILLASSCQNDHPNYMDKGQRREMKVAHDSLQATYQKLLSQYKFGSDSLQDDLEALYTNMQRMHHHAESNYKLMMTRNKGRDKKENKMMKKRMRMGMQMQIHMTGEWFSQMMTMHQKMAQLHEQMGQKSMAQMNQRLYKEYRKMEALIPGLDEAAERPFNKKGDPALLNGERLFAEKCSSCHSDKGSSMAHIFPPVVNTTWVTGDKSIPLRIVLHGLQDDIKVGNTSYSGMMPAFKSRLSAAEIGAILNYLRKESEGDFATISQQDVINVSKTYSKRTKPWKAKELMKK